LAHPSSACANTIRGIEDASFQLVMISTIVAGIWSLMSGTVAISAFAAVLWM
jgi:hypothetical protein